METSYCSIQSTPIQINILPENNSDAEIFQKYKTEMCRNWLRGTCTYGNNCLFAHGEDEIRFREKPANYKTKLCVNILRDGFCKYGTRCQFKHCEDIASTAASSPLTDQAAENTQPKETSHLCRYREAICKYLSIYLLLIQLFN